MDAAQIRTPIRKKAGKMQTQVSATLYVDPQGRLINITAQRYAGSGGQYSLTPWSVPIEAYGEFDGLRLPVAGKVVWNYPAGDFAYFEWQVTRIEFNKSRKAPGQ